MLIKDLPKGDELKYLENELEECRVTRRKALIFKKLYLRDDGKNVCWWHWKKLFFVEL